MLLRKKPIQLLQGNSGGKRSRQGYSQQRKRTAAVSARCLLRLGTSDDPPKEQCIEFRICSLYYNRENCDRTASMIYVRVPLCYGQQAMGFISRPLVPVEEPQPSHVLRGGRIKRSRTERPAASSHSLNLYYRTSTSTEVLH
jgi:hypothetical protein